MSFIELHPDLRETNALLSRIAAALETHVFHAYGIRLGVMMQPATDPHPEEKVTIAYSNDEDTARRTLEKLAKRGQAVNDDQDTEVWAEE